MALGVLVFKLLIAFLIIASRLGWLGDFAGAFFGVRGFLKFFANSFGSGSITGFANIFLIVPLAFAEGCFFIIFLNMPMLYYLYYLLEFKNALPCPLIANPPAFILLTLPGAFLGIDAISSPGKLKAKDASIASSCSTTSTGS
jgi:hypothetical protein